MSNYDYKLVLQILANCLGKSGEVDYSVGSALEQLDVIFGSESNGTIRCKVMLKKFDMVIEINDTDVSEQTLKEMLSKFEFDLEQKLLRDIKLNVSSGRNCHILTIPM
ncbi:MAG: hypothetical protein KDK36_01575 [Leptospiraceae bacterium]|nr:hypothetical protein [Leptospiraceae bacterium]